ncbi:MULTISPECIES: restriction endonuclease subunit S [Acidithiobacillus]|jgi:type I restriction enzyme S subunit|uniref:Restriction endonuclease subunit S n=1 Tax=Acidithiobacillus ferrooxidans TaxID=920 RepID=A0A2W1KHP2_ACIFR|nr:MULTISPECIES: restriction endonuclease subunit S [Acidithiobacillus]MCL5957551.1 restriction endonuclease subunit S [Gammaproteobacteria bacterium]ACH84226.1 restriction modification system DNA specificity domain [Acidithiobacillus ferrooxidans ATCC 53993]MBN6745269.1 restriction endonuclease subunit S [Acidithiobacillus sp. MC2.2]MBN6747718.1 restriction endonuclease subunit S [Acidithiobacillus sp. PG05]MBU2824419.1 restriction endonuclease subunit S [Acidithiobacillus ferrooxidans]
MNPKAPSTVLTAETKPARVPKLRFPAFRGADGWKLAPLSQLATRTKQKNRDEKITRVLTNSAEFGVMDQRDFFDKEIATQGNLESYFVVELGSYVYNPRISATAPVGPISKNKVGTGVMSPLYTVFKFKDGGNDFYEHYFKTTGWHTYMRQASSTGARHDRMAISSDDFMAMPLPVPTPKEQQKIAECLSSVDALMAAQARKVDALKTHKKGLMQQLFPTEGETQPRLRFPEFQNAGEWNKTTLGEAATFFNGRAYKQEELLESGKYPVLRVGNFFTNNNWYYSDLELDETKYCDKGDLLYAWSASFGPRMWHGVKVIYHYHIWKVEQHSGIDRQFLFITLENETERMKSNSANGLGLLHITKGTIEGWDTAFPSPPEQHRIASCLSSLDALITLETQKLEALKTHKKGLMQQLFPVLNEVQG